MTIQVDPIRRNVKFGLPPQKVLDWNPDGLHVTQFFNTLSIYFPAGERFFIQSVRNYGKELTDQKLREQVSAFIGQEGFHTREHEAYNATLVAAGMPIEQLDTIVVNILEAVKKLPRSFQLATTVAPGHLTAMHDNREFLAKAKALTEQIATFQAPASVQGAPATSAAKQAAA